MSDSPDLLPRDRYIPTAELLGEGGMAKVWRVWHRERGAWCAVKILRARYAAVSDQRRRFLNEAHILLHLQHRNVVAAWEVGEGEFPFLVMEVADGGTIQQWVQRHGPMPPQMAVGIGIQICKGLAAAHKLGVVHRDVKPHNVLINRKGVCKISDFGIARIPRSDGSVDIPDATVQSSDAMGTLGYMAPEQRSDPKRADPRTDVYGVAATLVDLLTGRPQMNLFMAGQDHEMLADIPEVLRPILVRGAEYESSNRYPEVADFALALHHVRELLPELPPGSPNLADGLPAEPPPPLGAQQTMDPGDGRLDDLEVPTFLIRTSAGARGEELQATPPTVPESRSVPGPPPAPAGRSLAPVAAVSGGVMLAQVEPVDAHNGIVLREDPRGNAPRTPEAALSGRSPAASAARLPRPITFEPEVDPPGPPSARWTIVVTCAAGLLLGFWWMWWWVSTAETRARTAQEAFEAILVSEGPVVDQLVELGADRAPLGAAHDAVTSASNPVDLAQLVPAYLDTLDRAREQIRSSRTREVVDVERRLTHLHSAGDAWMQAYSGWSSRCDRLAGRIADAMGARCPVSER